MKFCVPVVLGALFATLLHSTEYVTASEICPQENCLDSSDKCEELVVGGKCPQSNGTCCSIVKAEYRTHCRHFGGECMGSCAQNLQQSANDCSADEVCCVLV